MADPEQKDADKKDVDKEELPPVGDAVRWVARISSIISEMVFPAMIGLWLDGRWGTAYLGPAGLILGVSLGMWHLYLVSREFK